ncbi:MAG TPA: glycerophosphodiester phosphodiesterase [Acidimicrobiales bacterium]
MTSRWLERRVLAYAHQGGARQAPSSTLMAMEQALAAGATGLELDVHGTADGHLVVCHDATVDRTTDGTGAIAGLTLAQLQRLDNAYWWAPGEQAVQGRPPGEYPLRGRAPTDPDLGIATLRSVLERFPGVILNLDIKQTAPAVRPYEADLAAVLREHGRVDDVIVASFDDRATDAFSAAAPEIATSAGAMATALFCRAVAVGEQPPAMRHAALQVPASYSGVELVTREVVAAAHRAGVAVHVWTVDDPAEMERLLDLGVDGIISDVPSVLVGALRKRGVAWPGPAGSTLGQPRPQLGFLP